MTLKISYISIHKKQGVLSFLLIFFTCASFAQTIKVRGEYKSVSLKYYSLDEACQLCYDYARSEALASTFGEGLVGRTVITGDEQGSQMRDIQETFAKGTWVKTLKKDFETFDIEPEGKNQKKRYKAVSIQAYVWLLPGCVYSWARVLEDFLHWLYRRVAAISLQKHAPEYQGSKNNNLAQTTENLPTIW